MKRRFFSFALVAMTLVPPLSAQAQPDQWQTVVGRDLRFRLEMPAPATETRAAEKEKGHAGERIAWASKRDGEMFDFDYVDYAPGWFTDYDSKTMARELGRGEAEKAFPRATFKYIREVLIPAVHEGARRAGRDPKTVLRGGLQDGSLRLHRWSLVFRGAAAPRHLHRRHGQRLVRDRETMGALATRVDVAQIGRAHV